MHIDGNLAIGAFIGVAAALWIPRVYSAYKFTQFVYDRAYTAGRSVNQAHVRRALRRLVECNHAPPHVCDACANFTRGELSLLLRDETD